jgi:hypothetical protein
MVEVFFPRVYLFDKRSKSLQVGEPRRLACSVATESLGIFSEAFKFVGWSTVIFVFFVKL